MVLKIKERIKNQKGFTLVELMATLGILALIVAIAVPAIGGIIDNADKQADGSSINMIESAGSMAYMGDEEFSNKSKESYTVPKLVESGYLDISKDSELYDSLNYVAKSGNKFKYHQIDVSFATDDDFSENRNGTYSYIGSDKTVRIPHEIDGNKITSYEEMFEGTSVTKVISDNSNITDMKYMFYELKSKELDLSDFNTENVTNMDTMFANSHVINLDLSGFDTSKVTNMYRMFMKSHAESINLSSFTIPGVKNMKQMFNESKIKELDLSSFDFTNVDIEDMDYMLISISATIGYAKSTEDIEKLERSEGIPNGLTFTVK